MQNYKDSYNKIHVLDDVAFEHLLPAGCVPITQEEADALVPKPNSAKLKQRELTALNKVFDADMQSLRGYWINALIANDEEMKVQIMQEMTDAGAQFATDRAAIIAKYTNP